MPGGAAAPTLLDRLLRPGRNDASRGAGRSLCWLIGLGCLLIGAGLGLRDPWPPDEPRFALIARDMLATGDWLVPRVAGDLYTQKPPLLFLADGGVDGADGLAAGGLPAAVAARRHRNRAAGLRSAATRARPRGGAGRCADAACDLPVHLAGAAGADRRDAVLPDDAESVRAAAASVRRRRRPAGSSPAGLRPVSA